MNQMAPVTLKDGSVTLDRRMDRCMQFDERSRKFQLQVDPWAGLRDRIWTLKREYYGNQGQEGACVEYGITHELGSQPQVVPVKELDAIRRNHKIYWPAQQDDPWPGGSYPGATPMYEGTSVLSGVKQAVKLGYYTGYDWTFDMEAHVKGVIYNGPAIIGVQMTEGMMEADSRGLIQDEGQVAGGHCMAWIGCRFDLVLARGYPKLDIGVLAQSWGLSYGDQGRVYIPLSDLEARLKDGGEVCHPRRA